MGQLNTNRVDLRGLIIKMMEKGDESVDLDDLMLSIYIII